MSMVKKILSAGDYTNRLAGYNIKEDKWEYLKGMTGIYWIQFQRHL